MNHVPPPPLQLTHTCSIADELLDDLLLQVITEVEQICDSCVDGLITEEFIKP